MRTNTFIGSRVPPVGREAHVNRDVFFFAAPPNALKVWHAETKSALATRPSSRTIQENTAEFLGGVTMKYLLITAAVIVGLVLIVVGLAVFTHFFDHHERVGHFDVYCGQKTADSTPHCAL